MDKEETLLAAIDAAEAKLKYYYVFYQETGEEAVVHDITLEEAVERYPEWTYRYADVVRDAAYFEWRDANDAHDFWVRTKDMDEQEYEYYMDSLVYDYELEEYN